MTSSRCWPAPPTRPWSGCRRRWSSSGSSPPPPPTNCAPRSPVCARNWRRRCSTPTRSIRSGASRGAVGDRRLEAIVNDLLLLARLRVADPVRERIDLGKLVTEEASAQANGVPVYVRAAPGVCVYGSQIRLIRVVNNLLSNARRTPTPASRSPSTPPTARPSWRWSTTAPASRLADRERVFERFTRLGDGRRRDSGGSGLGLAISRDIAEAHHGTLRIEDSPRGARFVLRLPLLNQNIERTGAMTGPVARGRSGQAGASSPILPGSRRWRGHGRTGREPASPGFRGVVTLTDSTPPGGDCRACPRSR
ncbi:sensor histidine kinase [Streptosporangium lutulentum]